MRELVEGSTLSCREIAARTGTSAATVSRQTRARAWQRPEIAVPVDCATPEGRRIQRRRAIAAYLMRQAEAYVFETEMNPQTRPRTLERAFRLLRLAKAFDEIDKPKRRVRRRPRSPLRRAEGYCI